MKSIAELTLQLGSEDPKVAYQANLELSKLSADASKSGTGQSELAAALATELTATNKSTRNGKEEERPTHSAAVKNQIAQFLSIVASESQVPALTNALGSLPTREMARWALDRIPAAAATSALIAALEQVGPEFRTGVINAMAKRKGP